MRIVEESQPTSRAPRRRLHRRPIPRQTEMGRRRRTIAMLAMALGAFALGTTEFTSMGLLPLIAADFGVSEDTASTIISAYALGVVVGAPGVAALTAKLPRRRLILILLGLIVAGNLASVAATSYPVLLGARFVAGLPHGAYFSVAMLATASMSPPAQRGRALAFVVTGLTVATIVGVPLAQVLGQNLGWHAAYGVVAVIALVAIGGLWIAMPHMTQMAASSIRQEFSVFTKGQVWLTLLIGVTGFAGMFAVYTYITWIMTKDAGLPEGWMWLILMIFGGGMTAGNWLGGRLADWNVEKGLVLSVAALAAALIAFYFSTAHVIPATVFFTLIGVFGMALQPSLQVRLLDHAGEAQTLAAALNQSALNTANAGGAAVGGLVVGAGLGFGSPAPAGAVLSVIAVVLCVVAARLARSSAR